ncbi:MAG: AAA family ATPase [Anaeromicrobium sp.]|jgi:SpoVK/Ycf46/Vps4 family AAA+-type ATPase|uniref:AAA family ATPase n=1 Tax=Anaeromicrobium sp. TaxID=1929132 RepID=UPI0025D9C439|nr:AAA family ATPase [Anaeromicrobium sp.]MCT4595161.1 AAA family ATPase [Anaeromicrobium sp.]
MDELQVLIKALEVSADNSILRSHVAKLQFEGERYEEAYENYKIIYDQENDLESLEGMLKSLLELEDYEEALEIVEDEIEERQNWAFGYKVLSECLYDEEEYEEAKTYYEKAVELDTNLRDEEFYEELLNHTGKEKVPLKVINFSAGEEIDGEFEKPKINFENVAGLEDVKESIRSNIIFPLQNPEIYRAYGKSAGGGILLYGPPGCGKTFISMATAGECNAHFVSISITDILDMYLGESEKNLHTLFETARLKAPSIIFIDEIDAIGSSRQGMKNQTSRTLTNQLLIELDSTRNNNENLLVIGATNMPWYVDSAIRRPGRFDRIQFIPPPDTAARIEILKLHLKDRPCEDIDYTFLAKKMKNYSGADIKGVCDFASDRAIKKAMKAGKIVPINTDDLLSGIRILKPSTIEWLKTAKNYATYSNQSGIYDEILEYFEKNK